MEKIFISFSGGRSSALTTRILVERYGRENCIICLQTQAKKMKLLTNLFLIVPKIGTMKLFGQDLEISCFCGD